MPQIINLSPIGEVLPGDSLPIFDESNGDTRRVSVGQMQTYMQNNLDMPDNSDEVNFLQAGTGAVTRTVQAKLRESVSVKDFGAVGDGITDDTAAVQAALNTGKSVFFPEPSNYYNIASSLTISVPFSAGAYRVFGGTGAIIFGQKSTPFILLEWFGVSANGADQLSNLNKAFSCLNSSSVEKITTTIVGEIFVSNIFDATAANKTIDIPATIKTVNPTTAVYETVRIAGDNCVVERLVVDRNRAATVWDGSFGTQPAIRFGTGSGILAKSIIAKNSMDEGVSIQNTDGLLIESLKVENAGEHGVYISTGANNVTINKYNIDGFGNAGFHSVVAAAKISTSSGIVRNISILSGRVNDGGATAGIDKFVIETSNATGIYFKAEVIDCDQVFNVQGGTNGSYNHIYEFDVQGCRDYICGANSLGVTRNIAIKNSAFPDKLFNKFAIFSSIENTRFLGEVSIDSGHDANILGAITLSNVIANKFSIAKNYSISAFGSFFGNISISNSASVNFDLQSSTVSVAANDAVNATTGCAVNISAENTSITAPRYALNGPIYLYSQNSSVVGTVAVFVNGAQYAIAQTTVAALTNKSALQLAGYYLWVDSTGALRIKNGAPTSDTDGTVVGTQT